MNSTSESGHSMNVANLEEEISVCTGYGAAYNPSKVNLKLASLQTLLTSGRNALQTVKSAKTVFDNATNAREIAFTPLKKLCTRIINALKATDATQQLIDDALTVNRKVQGKRAKKIVEEVVKADTPESATEAEHKNISVSQQGFDDLIDHYTKIIQVVSSEPLYVPNELDLKVTALNTQLTSLRTLNTAVINAHTAYSNAMLSRNIVLYQPLTGLVDIGLEVKNYVKSVFGATSPQYKQISKIKFTKHNL
ncbi:MAG: hypothetical protein WC223_13655 [Bacteroidales bacterium]|jgi:predicted  nucleic acid-binding Zn-ribbon protein